MEFLLAGIICRGAITRGKLIHTDDLLFGPAIIEAYILEKESAIYPRIIFQDEILQVGLAAHGRHHRPADELDSIQSLIRKDDDHFYYLDYFEEAQSELDDPEWDYATYLENLYNVIHTGLSNTDAKKYEWMKSKYVETLKRVKQNAKKVKDENLRDLYLALPEL